MRTTKPLCLFRYATKGGGAWVEYKGKGTSGVAPKSKGGDPAEGSVLGRLLWKPMPNRQGEREEGSKQREG